MTRCIATLTLAALLATVCVSTAEAGLFGWRSYRPHYHAPRVEYRRVDPTSYHDYSAVRIIRHVNDPSMFRDESGYGES